MSLARRTLDQCEACGSTLDDVPDGSELCEECFLSGMGNGPRLPKPTAGYDYKEVYEQSRRWAYWNQEKAAERLSTAEERSAAWEQRTLSLPPVPFISNVVERRLCYWRAHRDGLAEVVYG